MDNNWVIIDEFINKHNDIDDEHLIFEISYFLSEQKIELSLDDALLLLHSKERLKGSISTINFFPDKNISVLVDAYRMLTESESVLDNLEQDVSFIKAYDISDEVKAYLNEISIYRLLTKEEEQSLGIRISLGDKEAYQTMVNHNLRLVVSCAKKFINRGVPFLDLIQEGNVGLIKAVSKYDYRLGYKFSSYAVYWIRQSLNRIVFKMGNTISIPSSAIGEQIELYKYVRNFEDQFGRKPTAKEVCLAFNCTYKKAFNMLFAMNGVLSLSNPVGEDKDSELGDFIEDNNSSIDKTFDEICGRDVLDLVFNTDILTEHEKEILKLRFGIDGKKAKTLEEVGEMFGVTRESIRQREVRALKKLRRNREIRQYRNDVDLVSISINKSVKKLNLKNKEKGH